MELSIARYSIKMASMSCRKLSKTQIAVTTKLWLAQTR